MSTVELNEGDLGHAVRQHHLLVGVLLRDVQSKVDEGLEVSTDTPYPEFRPEHAEYTVPREAELDGVALDHMTRFSQLEGEISAKYGMKPLSRDAVDEMLRLRSEIHAAGDEVSAELTERYASLERRGLDAARYDEYVAEVQGAYRGTISVPEADRVQLGLGKELFHVMNGSDHYREGGWTDGECYPAAMRQGWVERGMVVEARRSQLATRELTMQSIFGDRIAAEIDRHARRGHEWSERLLKNKVGSKFLFGIYGGMLLWVMWFKWVLINEREIHRQQIKFAYRVLDEDAPLSRKQLAMLETRLDRTRKYFDEDDDDKDE